MKFFFYHKYNTTLIQKLKLMGLGQLMYINYYFFLIFFQFETQH
jgi:hypothetical protein